MRIEELLADAVRIVTGRVKHIDWDRTVELKTKYYRLATGDEHEKLLEQFVRREDEVAFEQRVNLTKTISPAVLNTAVAPFNKVPRSDSLVNKCLYEEDKDQDEKKAKELQGFKDHFNGEESMDEYFEDAFVVANHIDPNMFIVVEFGQFDPLFEKPEPYPFEVPSDQVFNYKYDRNKLQYLVVHQVIKDPLEQEGREHEVFTVYGIDHAIKFTEVENDQPMLQGLEDGVLSSLNDAGFQTLRAGGKVYQVVIMAHQAGFVPATRVGYIKDLQTDGRTYVSTWHTAMPYFDKMVKTVSEMDLSMTLHAFPQKLSYEQPCPGPSLTDRCTNGRLANGAACSQCGGSGFMSTSTTTAQDEIKLRMPRQDKDETFIDISKLIAYITPDIDTIKFLDEYIEKLERKVRKAVFNSDSFDRDEVVKTATEDMNDMDNIYDALHAFANNFSKRYRFITRAIATFTGLDQGLSIIHQFGNDFKLESKNQLIARWVSLNESNAPSFLKKETGRDIARMVFRDDPRELLKYQVKDNFMPFYGKSQEEIVFLLSNASTREESKVLYANFESIFDDLEFDHEDFYQKDYKDQKTLIDGKVQQLIEAKQVSTARIGTDGIEIEE